MRKLSLKDAHVAASYFNGVCLSDYYIGCDKKLKWKCENGHVFYKTLYDVRNRKRWCNKCEKINFTEEYCRHILQSIFGVSFDRIRLKDIGGFELDGYNEQLKIAFEYQGEHHYKEVPKFKNTKEDIIQIQNRDDFKLDRCNDMGITLIQIPYFEANDMKKLVSFIFSRLYKNNICIPNKNIDFRKIHFSNPKLYEAKMLAYNNGGRLLSETYYNNQVKMKWECKEGHHWYASFSSIKDQKSWCPYCANQIVTIKDMRKIAEDKSGKCLSNEYKNARTKLKWECCEGHVFYATPNYVKSHYFCPVCKDS